MSSDVSGEQLVELRPFYRTGDEILLAHLPGHCERVVACRASGEIFDATTAGGEAVLRDLPSGTYVIEAQARDHTVICEEITTVAAHPGERPVHGFVTSYDDGLADDVLQWLDGLRCTVVQFYDWMETYSAPLGSRGGWNDPSGRPVSYAGLRRLASSLKARGTVAHAYTPVYAVDLPFAEQHKEMLLYRGDGEPERLFDKIQLANPADPAWQEHFADSYGHAANSIGFDGFHLDTYGFPRAPLDFDGSPVDMRAAYDVFLKYFRARRPSDLLSFNQVNGVPSALELPPGPGFRYCEVWPPNDEWRHLEGLMDRSAGWERITAPGSRSPQLRGTIACYPPVWEPGMESESDQPVDREGALRTVVNTEAIATCLGASALLYGDVKSVLSDAYYPVCERLSTHEADTVLAWHRFALRCRDLFYEGEDTSWYDIADENGAVAVLAEAPVRPEPLGGSIFARVVRNDTCIAVGVVDLTGNASGRWSERTQPRTCKTVDARILLEVPKRWQAATAVLGRSGGRFMATSFDVVAHREGLAAKIELPIGSGWSVLRLLRSES